jgi:putative hemolysin
LGDLIAIALCLLGSGFFSASETALTALPVTRLEALQASSSRLVRVALKRWSDAPREFLITILVGNNLVNVIASALASRIAYRVSNEGALAIAVGVMTLAILIVGEITPKTLAQRHAEWVSVRVAPILYGLDTVLRPVNLALGFVTHLLTRNATSRIPVTKDDLRFMLRLAHRHEQLPRDARYMIESVLRFQHVVAREIMVPRPQVITLDTAWSQEKVLDTVREAGHSRFPLVNGSLDDIEGVIHAKALLDKVPDYPWQELAVPAMFIPERKLLPELLSEFRTSGQHMAVVLDEFGGCAGIVTLEDTIEIVVGEIQDEFDGGRIPDLLAKRDGWSVAGHVSLRRLEQALHRSISASGSADSVGGIVADSLNGSVEPGARVEWRGLELVVEAVDGGRASRILVKPVR